MTLLLWSIYWSWLSDYEILIAVYKPWKKVPDDIMNVSELFLEYSQLVLSDRTFVTFWRIWLPLLERK